MSTYEVTYAAHTGRPAEWIEAVGRSVDGSTTPPTHRFQVRGRITSIQIIERTDVEDVREIQASPLPPFARPVSNRAFPQGRRPGGGS